MSVNRRPAGTPAGGQYSASAHADRALQEARDARHDQNRQQAGFA